MTRDRTTLQWVALGSRVAIRVEAAGTSSKASPGRTMPPGRRALAAAGDALDGDAMRRIAARIQAIDQRLDRALHPLGRAAPVARIGGQP